MPQQVAGKKGKGKLKGRHRKDKEVRALALPHPPTWNVLCDLCRLCCRCTDVARRVRCRGLPSRAPMSSTGRVWALHSAAVILAVEVDKAQRCIVCGCWWLPCLRNTCFEDGASVVEASTHAMPLRAAKEWLAGVACVPAITFAAVFAKATRYYGVSSRVNLNTTCSCT